MARKPPKKNLWRLHLVGHLATNAQPGAPLRTAAGPPGPGLAEAALELRARGTPRRGAWRLGACGPHGRFFFFFVYVYLYNHHCYCVFAYLYFLNLVFPESNHQEIVGATATTRKNMGVSIFHRGKTVGASINTRKNHGG